MAFTQQTPIGTPDVNLITKTLANLRPDSKLQEYAALHKDNVYILSLAKSESDRRKAMRLAAQGNPGQQPTVADREIAGMAPAPMMAQQQLPENQGIAQIPTPNIRTMADGGIAGYEDDEEGMATGGMGGMFNFAQQSEPVVRMSGGGHIPRYQGIPKPAGDGSVVSSNPMYNVPGFQAVQPRDTFTQAGSPENMTPWERFSSYMGEKKKQATLLEIAYRIQTGIATPDEIVLYNSAEITGGDKAATDVKYPPQDAIRTKDFSGVKPGFEKMPAETGAPTDKTPPSATGGVKDLLPAVPKFDTSYTPAVAPTAADAKAKARELYDSKGQILSLEGKRLQAREDIFGEKRERLAQLEAFNKEQGPAFASYEKMLQKEELQDSTDKEKAGLMSLMKGFLAMAAGESPNAATNIAKGAMTGLGDYGDALKEFKKAAKERTKAMADIEQARRSEAKGDFKDTQMFTDRANERLAASDDKFTGLISQITGKEADVAASLLNNMTNITEETNRMMFKEAQLNKRFMSEQANANARTSMQVNAKGQTERLVDRMATDPKFKEEYKNYASIVPEAKGSEAELQAYLKNPMLIKATNPELAAYYDQLIKQRRLQPTSTPTGQVLVGQ